MDFVRTITFLLGFFIGNSHTLSAVIAGGRYTMPGEFPSVVRIRTEELMPEKDEKPGLCTATRVARDWILTAAHCVAGRRVPRVTVLKDRGTKKDRFVHSFYFPKDYLRQITFDDKATYDVALLYSPLNKFPKPKEVTPLACYIPWEYSAGKVVGYGEADRLDQDKDSNRKKVFFSSFFYYYYLNEIFYQLTFNLQFLASSRPDPMPPGITRLGDSGAPLISAETNEMFGILSYGTANDTSVHDMTAPVVSSTFLSMQHSKTRSFLKNPDGMVPDLIQKLHGALPKCFSANR